MQAARAFDDVLEATLGLGGTRTCRSGIATESLFGAPAGAWPAGMSAFRAFCAREVSHQESASSDVSNARRSAPRTGVERAAFDSLQVLGARLPTAFSTADLKHAFRSLAREWHPDRHLGVPPAERARLAAGCAAVRQAYLALRALRR